MFQFLKTSHMRIKEPNWLFTSFEFWNDASVSYASLKLFRSSGMKLRPCCFVSFKKLEAFLRYLYSWSVVGVLPGVIIWIGAETSGRTIMPTFSAIALWLVKSFERGDSQSDYLFYFLYVYGVVWGWHDCDSVEWCFGWWNACTQFTPVDMWFLLFML